MLAAFCFLILRFWTPSGAPESTVCLFRRFVGIPCPTCGLTRAFAHLAKGEWSAAASLHPLAAPFAIEIGLLWIGWGLLLFAPVRGPLRWLHGLAARRWELPLVLVNLTIFGAVWVLRLASGTLPP